MNDPKDKSEEEVAPVLDEDRAEPEHEDDKAIAKPIEEGQFDSQPGA